MEAHSFCSLSVESASIISIITPANQFLLCEILSVSVSGKCLPSAMFWHAVAAFFFFFLTELLGVLGGKSSGLVILRELGVFMCMLPALCVCV